ncbi:MAG: hypothetical protein LUF87_03205 [Alistipes sp.]|nr:hypothetical protein [Alistipes sp.]
MRKLFILIASCAVLLACSDDDDNGNPQGQGGSISLSSEAVLFDTDGDVVSGSASVTVTSDDTWSIVGKQDWFTVSSTSGSSGSAVTITPQVNTTGEDREQTLIFVSGSATAELSIRQAATLFDINTRTWNIPYEARSIWAVVTTDQDVTDYTVNVSWITPENVTKDSPWVIFAVDQNNSDETRTGTIIFAGGTPYENTITVTQAGIPDLNYSDITSYDTGLEADRFTVTFTTNVEEYAYSSDTWITFEEVSSTTTDGVYYEKTYRVDLSECEAYRDGSFSITDGVNTATVAITQSDPNPELFDIPDATFLSNLLSWGYIRSNGSGQYFVTQAGLEVTSLSFASYSTIEDLEGIEYLPELTSISHRYGFLKKIDVSKNPKMASLDLYCNPLEEVNLGDMDIQSLSLEILSSYASMGRVYSTDLKVISSNLETLSIYSTSTAYDRLETLDVTECPALVNLDARRPADRLHTIYINYGQVFEELEKNANTEFVIVN